MLSRESIVTAVQVAAVLVILYFAFSGYLTPKLNKSQARAQISEMSGIPEDEIEVYHLEYKGDGWTEVRTSVQYRGYQSEFLCNQTGCKFP